MHLPAVKAKTLQKMLCKSVDRVKLCVYTKHMIYYGSEAGLFFIRTIRLFLQKNSRIRSIIMKKCLLGGLIASCHRLCPGGAVVVLRNVWAEIDLRAVAHNVREAKKKIVPSTKLCAVVKADAYGHGAVPVAKTALAAGAEFLAVALLQEGVELREAGIRAPILVLGALQEELAEETVVYGLSQALFTAKSAQALSRAAVKTGKPARIHIAVETGMNRIGIAPEQAGAFAAEIAALPGIELEGVFSHLAAADCADKDFCRDQYARFKKALFEIRAAGIEIKLQHIANSAAIIDLPELQLDMVRQGITLYGLWPSAEVRHNHDFRPVMKLKTRVVFVKEIGAGETVSYGGTFKARKTTLVATLPVGYADGVRRLLSNKGQVIVRGCKAPIIGRICMDQLMIDVSNVEGVVVGDEVVLFGDKELSADQFAEWSDTISYEVVCAVSRRVPRVYLS